MQQIGHNSLTYNVVMHKSISISTIHLIAKSIHEYFYFMFPVVFLFTVLENAKFPKMNLYHVYQSFYKWSSVS